MQVFRSIQEDDDVDASIGRAQKRLSTRIFGLLALAVVTLGPLLASNSGDVADELLSRLKTFALAFQNWQDWYEFAAYFQIDQRYYAVATIERLHSAP